MTLGDRQTAGSDRVAINRLASDRIEILSVDLLDQNRVIVEDLKHLATALGLEFGWHYLLDLSWILSLLGNVNELRVMDAGAGTGILQWYLARGGARVISVDRLSREALPLRFRRRFRVRGLRDEVDLLPAGRAFVRNFHRPVSGSWARRWAVRVAAQAKDAWGWLRTPSGKGSVLIYNQDLAKLVDIADDTLDAVVSVSALEHNTPEGLKTVVQELMRVLKPGGVLLATLTAGKDQDWWHEASSGWCYTDHTLRQLFDLPLNAPSNYGHYDELFAALKGCAELRDNLASFYFRSEDKGMPGGVWDPQYQPVGICKVKTAGLKA
jgi:SAM-dependent methyltransferase